ncbi:hypothetical protein [Rhizobium sp. RAF56]|jgi:hypothetical protein
MAIRSLLIGISLIAALVLIVLSILLVNPTRPMHESTGLMPAPTASPQQ